MKSAEEIANEITNWLAKIGCALENSEEELLIGRIRAIQSDARESAIREAAEIASDKAPLIPVATSGATVSPWRLGYGVCYKTTFILGCVASPYPALLGR